MRRFLVALVAITAAPAAAAASPNLLENGGFELHSARSAGATGWTAFMAPGGGTAVDTTTAHSGQGSFRLFVPPTAPLNWYQVHRSVVPIRRGAACTLSGWVRTRDVGGGAGAYLSLNCFDGAGKRLAFFDSPGKAVGTAEWQRLTTTAAITDGTSELRVILCLHGQGTAWFDDVQVEEGKAATPYQPAAADAAALERHAADVQAAAPWIAALPPRPEGHARVAVLDMGLAGNTAEPLTGRSSVTRASGTTPRLYRCPKRRPRRCSVRASPAGTPARTAAPRRRSGPSPDRKGCPGSNSPRRSWRAGTHSFRPASRRRCPPTGRSPGSGPRARRRPRQCGSSGAKPTAHVGTRPSP